MGDPSHAPPDRPIPSPAARRRPGAARAAAGLAALLLASLGCPPPHHPPPPDAFTEAPALLAAAAEGRAALRSLAAEARVEYYGDDGVRKGTVIVAVRRPAAVRFEALSPTGDFLAVLVSDGERFVSFERGSDECYVGPACPVNVGRLLPIALPPTAVVHVLLGEAPLIAHDEAAVVWDAEDGRYDVTLAAPDRSERETIAFAPGDLLPRRVRVDRDDTQLFRVSYGAHRGDGALRHARSIRFRMPAGGVDLSLEYRDVELNPEGLDDDAFAFACPTGTEVWELACDGSPPRRAR